MRGIGAGERDTKDGRTGRAAARRGRSRRAGSVTTGLVAAGLVGGMVLSAAPQAAAASYPHRNWSQVRDNIAGVVFTACGDHWQLWDNVDDGRPARVYFNYKGYDDDWKMVLTVEDGYAHIQRNVYEGRQIYILLQTDYGNAPIVYTETGGGC